MPLGGLVDVAVGRVLLAALEHEMLEEMGHPVLLGALGARARVERDQERDRARALDRDPVQRQAVGEGRCARSSASMQNGSGRGAGVSAAEHGAAQAVGAPLNPCFRNCLQIALQARPFRGRRRERAATLRRTLWLAIRSHNSTRAGGAAADAPRRRAHPGAARARRGGPP